MRGSAEWIARIFARGSGSMHFELSWNETRIPMPHPQDVPPLSAYVRAFANLQAAIEAIDRAIRDEEQLPPDYAQGEPVAAPGSVTNGAQGSNVVDVDFDPA